ncbi:hypothetical protein HanRHA438_Chr09g0399481 [Helianthus annuus]|nr:hypothetical protein HanRHA438_Chr09g0399481 [Helianthus annuus]
MGFYFTLKGSSSIVEDDDLQFVVIVYVNDLLVDVSFMSIEVHEDGLWLIEDHWL